MTDDHTWLNAALQSFMEHKVPPPYALRVLTLALESEGVRLLVDLFVAESEASEREALLGALDDALDDHEPRGNPARPSDVSAPDAARHRRNLKAHMRAVVDQHGGVNAVARAAEMPQPSLSRLLNSGSQPRASTLARLGEAMGVSVEMLTGASHLRPSAPRRAGDGVRIGDVSAMRSGRPRVVYGRHTTGPAHEAVHP